MDILNKKVIYSKLITYGFILNGNTYEFYTDICDAQFLLAVNIDSKTGKLYTHLTDKSTGELYTLHLNEDTVGTFVGQIRTEYNQVLDNIIKQCYECDIFTQTQSKLLIEYVRNKYDCELEYLWTKFPDNAVWRRKDNKKWFGAILSVQRDKLNILGDGKIEVLDIRISPDKIDSVVDCQRYYYGYHMNKRHWVTIPLDGRVSLATVCKMLDTSYLLTK